jgi:hypothetical protein
MDLEVSQVYLVSLVLKDRKENLVILGFLVCVVEMVTQD